MNLDDTEALIKLDASKTYESVIGLPEQCRDAFGAATDVKVPDTYAGPDTLVMAGMGGSGLGARFIESVYGQSLPLPLIRINDYLLPAWVGKKSLVICSSFSGTTEETIENVRQAVSARAKWMAIGTGGQLIDLAAKHSVPFYKIDPVHNPSRQPRLAIGYSVVGQLVLVSKTGIISFGSGDLDPALQAMSDTIRENTRDIPLKSNNAKRDAGALFGKLVVFIGAGHMIGAIHTIKNQMNENAKNFSAIFDIPELNHHLMEGLAFPEANRRHLVIVLVHSGLYSDRIRRRFEITRDVISKNKIPCVEFSPRSATKLAQAFEFVGYGGLVNYYLSMLNGIDPAPIPWVDYFKKELGQSLGQWK
ncbi:hypothetical protein A2Z33_05275 [Candidatus Gottesmanbacteria bacterium RBG_16_52_11]|uniref:SIS domain-containing protein n=1 Tax=Candidatus Gottesmanbacteria bacterium RBG_16_52_11 TaxID=1798374 RepID=A0A1F5YQG5_9BACT|nr:MAG: hypothetical protein A2Z33_05275 [Candidatus Gottesmanbacteria bacterium RBG_16_52_11]